MKVTSLLILLLLPFLVQSQDLILKKKDGLFGFQDYNGDWRIPAEYNDAWHFSKGLALVKKGNHWGYIDQQNNTVIPFEYDKGERLVDSLAYVLKDGKYGLIHNKGVFIQAKYEQILFSQEWKTKRIKNIKVKKDGKWGVIDPASKRIIIPIVYEHLEEEYYLRDTAYIFTKNGLKGVVSDKGEVLIKPIADKFKRFFDNTVIFERNGKMGAVNKKGEVLVAPKYDYLSAVSNYDSVFKIKVNKNYGIFNIGKGEVVPPKYSTISEVNIPLFDGFSELDGQEIWNDDYAEFEYPEGAKKLFFKAKSIGNRSVYFSPYGNGNSIMGKPYPQENGNIWVLNPEKEGKGYYVYNSEGKLLTPKPVSSYRQIATSKGNVIVKSVGDKTGIYNPQTREWLVPPKHRYAYYNKNLNVFLYGDEDDLTMISEDFVTEVNGIVKELSSPEGSDFNYFLKKEGEKQQVLRMKKGESIDQLKKVMTPFDSASEFVDRYGNSMESAIRVERVGKKFYLNYVVDKEYGPIRSARYGAFSDGHNDYYYTEIDLKDNSTVILDEVFEEVISNIQDLDFLSVKAAERERDMLFYKSKTDGKNYLFDFETRDPIALELEGYEMHEVVDFSEYVYDEYGDETDEVIEDYLLILTSEDEDGKLSHSGIRCNTLIFDNVDEIKEYDKYLQFRKNDKWGLYIYDLHQIVEPSFDRPVLLDREFTKFHERPILTTPNSLIDYHKEKKVYPFDAEPQYEKFGKYFRLYTWWYDEGQDEEKKVTLTKGNYTELYPVSEVFDEFMDSWTYLPYLYLVKEDGKWGIIDIFENPVIPIIYDEIEFDYTLVELFDYSKSPLILHRNGETTIYDLRYKKFLLPFGKRTYDFNEEYMYFRSPIIYREGKKWGYAFYDNYGDQKVKHSGPIYDEITFLDDSYFIAMQREGQCDLVAEGGHITNYKIDRIHQDLYDFLWVSKGEEHFLMDLKGKFLYKFDETPKRVKGSLDGIIYSSKRGNTFCQLDQTGVFAEKYAPQSIDFLLYSDFDLVYKKDNNWYVNSFDFDHEVLVGKKKPIKVFEFNNNIIASYSSNKVDLCNVNSGVTYKSSKSRYVDKRRINDKNYLRVSKLNIYLDENLNEVEIESKKK